MSTRAAGRRTGRAARRVRLVLVILGAAACHRAAVTQQPSAVCSAAGNIALQTTIAVDSVSPTAGRDLAALRGQRFPIAITLFVVNAATRCQDQSGEASFDADLPPELATAVSSDHRATWRVQGTDVVVTLNPRAMDNDLALALPLSGDVGSWNLSHLAGVAAGGRVVVGTGTP